MPALDWDTFKHLPGSTEKNFELLCRGVVRQSFGSYGVFRALANQPGVEFHLKLDKPCDLLGEASRWWGWQCKWYELSPTKELRATRRAKIKEGLRKTEDHLPGLTDWVLWTRRPLTKTDQHWFHSLSSSLKLHLWTGDEVDNLLCGQAAALRGTYFGELVLTPDILRDQHEQAVAPIRNRWQPDVHHVGEAERELRRMLGELESWDVLRDLSVDLRENANGLENAPPVPSQLAKFVTDVIITSRKSRGNVDSVAVGIGGGDLDLVRNELRARPHALPESVATAPRRLRSGNHPAGLYATNAVAGCHDTIRALGDVEDAFSSRVVAVLASAGCGKTHLAAQLTVGTNERPHGVLLHGRELHATHSLDDLARCVSIAAQPVPSMESLLAAVDAAGQRAGHRLPVFIDGLNESEDPRTWKPLLASLETTLAKYPYVLLVCTLRPEFVADALPNGIRRVEITDYGEETEEAVHEHFDYWKIDGIDASLPEFLQHPLTLRIFCEVTNPTRQQVVGVNAMPRSLTALFERYLEQVSVRVVELASRAHRLYAQDVNAAISTIANMLWDSRARSIGIHELRQALGDGQRPWDQSLVRALEHEGMLLRVPSNQSGAYVLAYDLLGGHIVANALLAKHGQFSFESWIKEPATTTFLAGDYNDRHPLCHDVVVSLVAQVPRRFPAKQLWQMVDDPLRGRALRLAAHLESASLDAATVDALLELVREGDAGLLGRLWEVRGSPAHPLNAEALDRILRTMTVADRDLRWTEWLRTNQDDVCNSGRSVLRDLENLEQRWTSGPVPADDRLRARWVMWTLTSTMQPLRDQATKTLYRLGCIAPETLFDLVLDSLELNDPYVPERMLAAAYGVAMALWADERGDGMRAALPGFVLSIIQQLFFPEAPNPTRHVLMRDSAIGLVALALRIEPDCIPLDRHQHIVPPFGRLPDTFPEPADKVSESIQEDAKTAIGRDFGNYTIGRLIRNRRNYDYDHPDFLKVTAQICARINNLGYTRTRFEAVDTEIGRNSWRTGRSENRTVERYGKKYSRIAFFEMYGLGSDQGTLPEWRLNQRPSDVDIDPSFPDPPREWEPPLPDEFTSSPQEAISWMADGPIPCYDHLRCIQNLDGTAGPWIMLDADIEQSRINDDRITLTSIQSLFIPTPQVGDYLAACESAVYPDNLDIPSPRDEHYTYAGEIPWSHRFGTDLRENGGPPRQDIRDSYDVHNGTKRTAGIPVEVPTVRFSWEGHHSPLNQVSGAMVPGPALCEHWKLTNRRGDWDLYDPDGRVASVCRVFRRASDTIGSHFAYVRADLLCQYLNDTGQSLVWLIRGERNLHDRVALSHREALADVYQERRHMYARQAVWRPDPPFK